MNANPLVLAFRTYSLSRAEVVNSMLNAYGIPAVIFDKNVGSNYAHLSIAMGGYRIMVPQSTLADCKDLIAPFYDPEDRPESEALRENFTFSAFVLMFFFFTVGLILSPPPWLRWRKR